MLTKCFSLLMLIVATQFSQGFAAPRDGIIQDKELSPATTDADSILHPVKELLPPQQSNPTGENVDNSKPADLAEAVNDGVSTQPIQSPDKAIGVLEQPQNVRSNENAENLVQPTNSQVESAADAASSVKEEIAPPEKSEQHWSHMLTREQELKILHQVPEFTQIIRAMEELPDDIYAELKNFLESTVPRMPENNLFTQHFKNAEVLIHMFERLIKVARTGGVFKPTNQELFDRVHQAAPAMRREMHEFNGFIANAQSRLANLGTSTNPLNHMAQPHTAGINVATGSVSLPVPEQMADNVSQPKLEQMAESVAQPMAEQINDSVAQPAAEQIADSVAQPEAEQIADSVPQAVEEKMSDSVSRPIEQKTEPFINEFSLPGVSTK